MARIGITYEQVNAMANAIVGEGMRPTIESIRQRLGTGSPNTIHRHLAAWRAAKPVQAEQKIELPASILAAIAAEIERAQAAARAEIESRLVELQSEAESLAETGERLEAEIEWLTESLNEAGETIKTKDEENAGMANQIRMLKDQVKREQDTAEAARVDKAKNELLISGYEREINTLHLKIAQLERSLTEEQQTRTQAEKNEAVALAKLETIKEAAEKNGAKQAAQIEKLEKENGSITKEVNKLNVQVQSQQIALDRAVVEAEQAKAQAKEYREEAKKTATEAAELRGMQKSKSAKPVMKEEIKASKE
jgi:colicin import membrane protein